MIEAVVSLFVYECLFLIFFSPLGIIFFIIPEKAGILHLLRSCFAILSLVAYFATPWLAHRATSRRFNNNEQFHTALIGAFSDARFYLSFLPLVGVLFQKKTRMNQFESSDPIE